MLELSAPLTAGKAFPKYQIWPTGWSLQRDALASPLLSTLSVTSVLLFRHSTYLPHFLFQSNPLFHFKFRM